MKNLIFMIVLGAGLMSCSVVEGFMGGAEGEPMSFGGIIDSIWSMLTAFIPSLAAWEGAGSIFSPRKRQHYTNMVTAIVPMNKNMEFGDALKSLGSGLGLAHSSDASKAANEEEVTAAKVEAVTSKKA
jgi:hypothetical protein|tara:strand:+ start:707 stop:1090 length:384 start_codon:yes stop_codon:yes gene_type:complete